MKNKKTQTVNTKLKNTDPKKSEVLQEIGFKKNLMTWTKAWITLAIITAILAIANVVENKFEDSQEDSGFTTIMVAIAASAFAYGQWVEAKNEASIDKYYDRLNLTNEKFDTWTDVYKMFPDFWDGQDRSSYEKSMYVYLELDNLEYARIKYQHNSLPEDIAYRSLLTFISRCKSEDFRKLAKRNVDASIGYSSLTENIVEKIVDPSQIKNPKVKSWLIRQLKKNGASQFGTFAFLRGVETLGLSLCWLMFLQKRDAPQKNK